MKNQDSHQYKMHMNSVTFVLMGERERNEKGIRYTNFRTNFIAWKDENWRNGSVRKKFGWEKFRRQQIKIQIGNEL